MEWVSIVRNWVRYETMNGFLFGNFTHGYIILKIRDVEREVLAVASTALKDKDQ